jgi:hypothetical protein
MEIPLGFGEVDAVELGDDTWVEAGCEELRGVEVEGRDFTAVELGALT